MSVYLSIALTAAVVIGAIVYIFNRGRSLPLLTTGGNVCDKKHKHCCDSDPLELIVKFEEPLEININVNLITPEPEVRGELILGPVSEKKDKVI